MPEAKTKVEFHTDFGIIKPDEYYGTTYPMRCLSCRVKFGLPRNGLQTRIVCGCGHKQDVRAPHPFAPRR